MMSTNLYLELQIKIREKIKSVEGQIAETKARLMSDSPYRKPNRYSVLVIDKTTTSDNRMHK